jgi:hypothetical protein
LRFYGAPTRTNRLSASPFRIYRRVRVDSERVARFQFDAVAAASPSS